jgi:glutamyl-tRNA synthetase
MSVITRFAPAPSGKLHVGNIRTAVVNWLFARANGGRFILRLDDTDAARSSEESSEGIRRDLAWLGLSHDAEHRQSGRMALYNTAFDRLRAEGRIYACYETPEELDLKRKVQLSRGLPPVYDRAALKLSDADRARLEGKGVRPHWRFRLETDSAVEWHDLVRGPAHVDPASLSDPVVRRADGTYLYMLPSTVDDVDMGVTHVIRGEDHVSNTGIQIEMFRALGAPVPAFAHHPLIVAAEGALSKREGSGSIGSYRDAGIEPQAILALMARLGTADPVEPFVDLRPLIESFDLSRFGRAAARFDEAELRQLNTRVVHALPFAAVAPRLPPGMDEAAWDAIRPNLSTVPEAADWWHVVEGPVAAGLSPEDRAYVAQARAILADLAWQGDVWHALTDALKRTTGRKGRALFLPLRLALTGRDHGPDMAALLPIIGRARALERLAAG